MKLALLTSIFFLIGSCNATSSVPRNGESLLPPADVPTRTKDADPRKNSMNSVRDEIIEERSEEYGIPVLRKQVFGEDDYELRFWSTVETTYFESCLLVRRSKGKWTAEFIVPNIDDGRLVRSPNGRTRLDVTKIKLTDDGWRKFARIAKDRQLRPPLPYAPDSERRPAIMDEGHLTLEVKQGKQYDVVTYRAFTPTVDGKALVIACKEMADLFSQSLGCEHR